MDFQTFMKLKIKIIWRQSFVILSIHKPFLAGVISVALTILDPIGSAVLGFIGFKQTDRQAKYICKLFLNT